MLSAAVEKRPAVVSVRAAVKIPALHCWIVGYWRIVVSPRSVWRSVWNAALSVSQPRTKPAGRRLSSAHKTLQENRQWMLIFLMLCCYSAFCIYLMERMNLLLRTKSDGKALKWKCGVFSMLECFLI